MRWDDLFDDLAGQAGHQEHLERETEVADRVRREHATVALFDRLRAAGGPVRLSLADGSVAVGTLADAGRDWCLLRTVEGQLLVPVHAVLAAHGVPGWSAAPQGEVAARRSLGMVLRALAQAQTPVVVRLPVGAVVGQIVRVGADHVDVDGGAGDVSTVPFSGVVAVQERG